MRPILTVVAASVKTFAATNVDDIFLLTLFVLDRWGHRIGPFVLIGLEVISYRPCNTDTSVDQSKRNDKRVGNS